MIRGFRFLHRTVPQLGYIWMDMARKVEVVEYTFVKWSGRYPVSACFARWEGLEYAFLNETSEVSYKILPIGNGFPLHPHSLSLYHEPHIQSPEIEYTMSVVGETPSQHQPHMPPSRSSSSSQPKPKGILKNARDNSTSASGQPQ